MMVKNGWLRSTELGKMIETIDIKIVTAKNDAERKNFASIALRHRLYISQDGWQLAYFLRLVKNLDHSCDISLAYINDVPVGVSLLLHDMMPGPHNKKLSNQISVFVRKSYRKMGIGTRLLNTLKDKKSNIFAREGIEVSKNFYEKQNVYIAEW